SVLFITHDLEEAISLADRAVVMSAGPAARPVGDYPIGLPRPRDVAEIRLTQDFLSIHQHIWQHLRGEVMKSYEQAGADRKSTRLNSSHVSISYAVICLKK